MSEDKSKFDYKDPVFRQWLRDMLSAEDVGITFTKTDGTKREMLCTLRSEQVVPYEKKTDRDKISNPDTLAVWDIDKKGWRSFRYDSINEIRFTIGSSL